MLAGFQFFQIGFNPLERFYAFALKISLASASQNRFSQKTILHPKPLLDGLFKKLVFSQCHNRNVITRAHLRKLKIPDTNAVPRSETVLLAS